MKKFYSLLLYCTTAALLLWVAGCSTEQPDSINGPSSVGTEQTGSGEEIILNSAEADYSTTEGDVASPSVACCLSPSIQCISSTDTSITIRICAGSTGAPGGLYLQWAAVPEGTDCASFVFPSSGVASKYLSGAACLPPYGCVTVTIKRLECGTTYAFRAKALNQYYCFSPWGAKVCCTTQDCETVPPPCLDEPVAVCQASTDTSITIRVTAGASGAPAGFLVQYAELPEGTACADFVWPASGVASRTTAAVAPNAYKDVEIRGLECGIEYVFRVLARECFPYCPSDFTANLCCTTDDCEAIPCLDVPTVVCYSETDTSITVRVTAGALGAPAGFLVQYAELPEGTACADFVWPTSGVAYKTTGAVAANGYVDVTVKPLECGTTYVFRALAKECFPNCPSEFSGNVCCTTDDCEAIPCVDVPTVECKSSTDTTITVTVCAGATGAGGGVLVQIAALPEGTACADFVWPASGVYSKTTGALGANGCVDVTFRGLECGTTYVFRVKGLVCVPHPCPSEFSGNVCCSTADCEAGPPPDGCVLTQGYWKNHESDWPVQSLTLGGVVYTQAQLLTVLNASVRGNAVLILGKQLIAATLNIEAGADASCIADALNMAETLLSANNINLVTSVVRTNTTLGGQLTAVAGTLNAYNNGLLACAEHCD